MIVAGLKRVGDEMAMVGELTVAEVEAAEMVEV